MSVLLRRILQTHFRLIVRNKVGLKIEHEFSVLRHAKCGGAVTLPLSLLNSPSFIDNTNSVRYKSKSKKAKQKVEAEDEEEELSEHDDDWEKELVDKNTKIIQPKVNSLRADVIIKSGLGISRNKVEELFYESRIRVNGKKIFKKSETLNEGDEIDVIKGLDVKNPKFLTVARVEILSAIPKGEGFSVKLRRCKSLTVENYEEPWQLS